MSNCKSSSTPLAAHLKLSSNSCPTHKEKIEKMSHVLLSSAVDSFM